MHPRCKIPLLKPWPFTSLVVGGVDGAVVGGVVEPPPGGEPEGGTASSLGEPLEVEEAVQWGGFSESDEDVFGFGPGG